MKKNAACSTWRRRAALRRAGVLHGDACERRDEVHRQLEETRPHRGEHPAQQRQYQSPLLAKRRSVRRHRPPGSGRRAAGATWPPGPTRDAASSSGVPSRRCRHARTGRRSPGGAASWS